MGDKLDQIKALTLQYAADMDQAANDFSDQMTPIEEQLKALAEEAKGYLDEYTQRIADLTKQYLADIQAILTAEPSSPTPEPV